MTLSKEVACYYILIQMDRLSEVGYHESEVEGERIKIWSVVEPITKSCARTGKLSGESSC